MAEDQEDADDKPFDASQKRLDDARKKGEVPHSADLTTAAAFGGLLLAASALGPASLKSIGGALASMLERAAPLSELWFSGAGGPAALGTVLAVVRPAAAWFLLPMGAALLTILAQRAFVVSGERLAPKIDRISPIQGAKNKFGRNGLFEFAKSTTKLTIISVCLGIFAFRELPDALSSMAMDPGQVTVLVLDVSLRFLAIVFLLLAGLGGIDILWQQAEHQRKHRMSRKELMDEQKDSEGDPHMKGRRRGKAMEIANNRMMADVPRADVVIVNPTHYAVALKWDRNGGGAPVCLAKGVDEVAMRIRTTAIEAGVPVRHDPPTARVLHRMVDVGQEIAPEHYRAVAVAIRFADRVRSRARKT